MSPSRKTPTSYQGANNSATLFQTVVHPIPVLEQLPSGELKNAESKTYPIPEPRNVELVIRMSPMIPIRVIVNGPASLPIGLLKVCFLPSSASGGNVKIADLASGGQTRPQIKLRRQ